MEERKQESNFNSDLLGDCRPIYAQRASRIKTKLQKAREQNTQDERVSQRAGLSKTEFWKTVKTQQDVERYYKIFHPEYSEELAKAIAIRLTKIVEKSQEKQALTPDEIKYLKTSQQSERSEEGWDPAKELQDQKNLGLINLCDKRMKDLLNN